MQSSSAYASLEDASTSGTMVVRDKRDDPESPRTPKSRLGDQERTSGSSIEDSATNLAEVNSVGYFVLVYDNAISCHISKSLNSTGNVPS